MPENIENNFVCLAFLFTFFLLVVFAAGSRREETNMNRKSDKVNSLALIVVRQMRMDSVCTKIK